MSILDQLERHGRRWTVDEMGHHVQLGDLLDEACDAIQEEYGLFSLEAVSERLMEKLEPVLTKVVDGEEQDKKMADVIDVRAALEAAGL